MGMQDQAFLGPESALAVPAEDGGIDLHLATQWLHVDQGQVAASLGLPVELVRLHLAGVGGAFGGREDLSISGPRGDARAAHGAPGEDVLLARGVVLRPDAHRHPARMEYEHGATRDGRLVYVHARIVLDGGAYASSSTAVVANAATFACGPYDVPYARIDAAVAYTNNPPAARCAASARCRSPSRTSLRWTAWPPSSGSTRWRCGCATPSRRACACPTGQVVDGPAPVRGLLEELRAMPLPPEARSPASTCASCPAASPTPPTARAPRRGVGFAVGFKNIGFAEGFDDYSTARVRLSVDDATGRWPRSTPPRPRWARA